MSASTITAVTIRKLRWEIAGRRMDASGFYPVGAEGHTSPQTSYVLSIATADGIIGEHTWTTGVNGLAAEQIATIAPWLIGRDAMHREDIWVELHRIWRKYDRLGIGPIDIALWDIAGKKYGASVGEMLGGYRAQLPAYASTLFGDDGGSLDSPEAFADFAVRCVELGYTGFKIHGWNTGPLAREITNVRRVREAVGPDVDLMLDPSGAFETFADALRVGRACDDANFFWYEDPYKEGGVSAFAHNRLRGLLRTPLLMGEHVRGLSAHVDQVLAGGTDFVRADAGLDGGITGLMKIAHNAEGLGLDVELHGPGPAHRQCMSALRNSNYYELGLLAPSLTNPSFYNRVYTDYHDDLDSIDPQGNVSVPDGPGLGVTLDEDWIDSHLVDTHEVTSRDR